MLCPEGSFLVPEISILFGDAVGASLVITASEADTVAGFIKIAVKVQKQADQHSQDSGDRTEKSKGHETPSLA